ncbi:hypothetical protein DPMN_179261 [Dreissena polymorpha]|uniref:Uncharacterized protein n=1 Tax=Dreissena polymorpha TaxID=45954 RepID=A0A9D4INC5_DREPO|nr:hypothetical protein DPMN_179261 [Dreissena polymorpha]
MLLEQHLFLLQQKLKFRHLWWALHMHMGNQTSEPRLLSPNTNLCSSVICYFMKLVTVIRTTDLLACQIADFSCPSAKQRSNICN